MTEIELNFRLDEHGRTSKPSGSDEPSALLDYESKTVQISNFQREWLDDLLFDCQISDSGLMPRTFWMPAQGMKPRCHLEQMALDIFHHHVKDKGYEPSCSGAEWWAQIRPSPEKTGRYAMHDDDGDSMSRSGISFHWDKDEDLRLLTGGTTFIHPHLSTVTYLTDLGAPTLALNRRVHNLTGEWQENPGGDEGFVSWPQIGKHLSFDGRFLHAAPANLMEHGAWEKQIELPEGEVTTTQRRRYRRVTFLVNIWLNYKPFETHPFPETMIDKMSGQDPETRNHIQFDTKNTPLCREVFLPRKDSEQRSFTWPMGDCDSKECIEVQMPLHEVRAEATNGGSIRIKWKYSKDYAGVRLFKKASEETEEKRKLPPAEQGETKRPKSAV